MTILESMADGYLLATGKATLPDATSSKYKRLFGLAKKLHRDWGNEPGVDWNSLYGTTSAGTVSATDTFDLDDELLKPSLRREDFVRILVGEQYLEYPLVDASELYDNRYDRAAAIIGQTVVFSRAFTTNDQAFGGTITVPGYLKPEAITSVNDDVLIDNPGWLGHIIATFYVMTDAQLNYLYPDLLQQANQLMIAMKENNSREETSSTGINYFSVGL